VGRWGGGEFGSLGVWEFVRWGVWELGRWDDGVALKAVLACRLVVS